MFIAAQQFIEKNINLLENDSTSFFIELWESEMSQEEAANVIDTLTEAKIDISAAHTQALINIIDHQVKHFARANTGVSAMPLTDFMFGYIYNFIGYGMNDVEEVLFQNAHIWKDDVRIFLKGDMPVIERLT